jgi:hypothetical protein
MIVSRLRRFQHGATALEAFITAPLVLFACLLVLQLMLLYRAKLNLNFATQEAARIGAMSNGRPVPRFLSDLTQMSSVLRTRKKCIGGGTTTNATQAGTCPTGTTEEPVSSAGPTTTPEDDAAGGNAEDDEDTKSNSPNSMRGQPTSSEAGEDETKAPAPAPVPTASAATAAQASGKPSVAARFFRSLGRGMMRYGDSSVLQGFMIGIAPLYTNSTNYVNALQGQLKAYGDATLNTCILYHNPTHAAFLDFGFVEVDGPDRRTWQIPNDLLRYRIPGHLDPVGKGIGYYKANGTYLSETEPGLRGKYSKMSVQDATLLSIEIKYSYPLEVPIARNILIGLAKLTDGLSGNETALGRKFNSQSLDRGRWPMASFATYRMQTPLHWHYFYPFGDISNVKTTNVEAFDILQLLYNKISTKINDDFDLAAPQAGFCPGFWAGETVSPSWFNETEYANASAGGNAMDAGAISWIGKDYDKNK